MTGSGESPSVAASPKYSTLELIKHDATAAAPERDHAVVAAENDRQLDALQMAPVPGAEVSYSDIPPEALNMVENRRFTLSNGSAKPTFRLFHSPLINTIVTAIITTVLVGAAVGVGVGVGLKKQRSGSGSSTTGTVSGSIGPTYVPLLTNKRILDDTSIAALALSDEDRRLFFQDQSGIIRQAFYTSSSKEWRADIDYVVALDAKNYTPITAFISSDLGTVQSEILAVFYIHANNSLAHKTFFGGDWHDSTDLSKYVAAADSRHLSVATGFSQTWLLYEPSDVDIAVLNGSLSSDSSTWIWKEISKEVQASSQDRYSAPFSAVGGDYDSIQAFFASKHGNGSYSKEILLSEDNIDGTVNHTDKLYIDNDTLNIDPDSIQHSDILTLNLEDYTYGFWVNDKILASFTDPSGAHYFRTLQKLSRSPFPFTRLAGFTDTNSSSSSLFVYHQLNASTFGEEQWDDLVGEWISSSFTIGMV